MVTLIPPCVYQTLPGEPAQSRSVALRRQNNANFIVYQLQVKYHLAQNEFKL